MRILVVTTGCQRGGVSESLVGYRWVSELARGHEVTLLNFRRRAEPPAAPSLPGVRVVEWVEPPGLERIERFNTMARPAYALFWARGRRWIREAQRAGEDFDVAHQPVPVALRYPSPLLGLGIPYILGPLGGSLSDPPGFAETDTSPWFVQLRRLDHLRLQRDPLLRRSFADASCVLGIAPYVADLLSDTPVRRFESMPDTALDVVPPPVDRSDRQGPVRLLFVGRVVRTKGVRDAVAAMAHVRDLDVVLDVVGDGHDRGACEELARELGLGDRVRFHGIRKRPEVEAFYRDADVFVFPSYREAGGTVTFEALGFGLPMIVCDRGGPAFAVDGSCGIQVRATDPDDYARQIGEAVRRLVVDPAARLELGQGARRRAEEVGTWASRVAAMEEIMGEVVGQAR